MFLILYKEMDWNLFNIFSKPKVQMPSIEPAKILVVGAGVLGLTTALTLAESLNDIEILVIGKDLPGDNGIYYTSPKAGAQWGSPECITDPVTQKRHRLGYRKFEELSKKPDAWVKPYDLYSGDIGTESDEINHPFIEPWFKNDVKGFEYIGKDEAKFPGIFNLYKFSTFTISTTYYLQYLMNELIKKKNVRIQRMSIEKLTDSYEKVPFYSFDSNEKADLVINCTGLQFNFLKDVNDPKLHPVRGHTLIIENNLPYQVQFEEINPKEPGEFLMCFPRKEGGSALGGIYDTHSPKYDASVHDDYVERLITKAKKHIPELFKYTDELKLVRHNIGFRPGRAGGPRVEADLQDGKIVHNYGCGSLGYIESWGCASDVLEIIKKKLRGKKLMSKL